MDFVKKMLGNRHTSVVDRLFIYMITLGNNWTIDRYQYGKWTYPLTQQFHLKEFILQIIHNINEIIYNPDNYCKYVCKGIILEIMISTSIDYLNNIWCICTVEYYAFIKKKTTVFLCRYRYTFL